MKIQHKVLSVSIGLLLAGASSAFAADMNQNSSTSGMFSMGDMQYGVSTMYDELTDDMGIGLDVQNQNLEMGLTGSVARNETANDLKYTESFLGLYGGYRQALQDNVYAAVGVQGNYGFHSGNADTAGLTKNPFTVGPYVGLEYQPTSHIQIFTRVMPYSYERKADNEKQSEFFQEGQIGLKYFF